MNLSAGKGISEYLPPVTFTPTQFPLYLLVIYYTIHQEYNIIDMFGVIQLTTNLEYFLPQEKEKSRILNWQSCVRIDLVHGIIVLCSLNLPC